MAAISGKMNRNAANRQPIPSHLNYHAMAKRRRADGRKCLKIRSGSMAEPLVATVPPRKSARLEHIFHEEPPPSYPPKQQKKKKQDTERPREAQLLPSPSTGSSSTSKSKSTTEPAYCIDPPRPSSPPTESNILQPTNCNDSRKRSRDNNLEDSSLKRHQLPDKPLLPAKSQPPEQPLPDYTVTTSNTSIKVEEDRVPSSAQNRPKRGLDPIKHWAVHGRWPESFAYKLPMSSTSNPISKRPRTLTTPSVTEEKAPSYSSKRKDGLVPTQYTNRYQNLLLTRGLDMDILTGEELVNTESVQACEMFLEVTRRIIEPSVFPQDQLRKVINTLGGRNEAIIHRDVTPMLIPSIKSLFLGGEEYLEHVVDEINADWYGQCIIEGPHMRPDLAIGLSSAIFTDQEVKKLDMYKSAHNWTLVTDNMCFPFLMCEVKASGKEDIVVADRQNMHSCSVAVRAILRLQQEADKYRPKPKTKDLDGKILVFSISHNGSKVELYGHFGIMNGTDWKYYRHQIHTTFDIRKSQEHLLKLHNFVKNVLKEHLQEHVERLKDAISVLPESATLSPSEAADLPVGDGDEDNQPVQGTEQVTRDADGFVIPPIPQHAPVPATPTPSAQNEGMLDQIAQLMSDLVEERKARRGVEKTREAELKARYEEMKAHDEEMKAHEEEMKALREEAKAREKETARLIALLKERSNH